MEQHIGAFWTLLKFLIREDLSLEFRDPKEKWWYVGTQFSQLRQGDLFFAFYLIYLKEKKSTLAHATFD